MVPIHGVAGETLRVEERWWGVEGWWGGGVAAVHGGGEAEEEVHDDGDVE